MKIAPAGFEPATTGLKIMYSSLAVDQIFLKSPTRGRRDCCCLRPLLSVACVTDSEHTPDHLKEIPLRSPSLDRSSLATLGPS